MSSRAWVPTGSARLAVTSNQADSTNLDLSLAATFS